MERERERKKKAELLYRGKRKSKRTLLPKPKKNRIIPPFSIKIEL